MVTHHLDLRCGAVRPVVARRCAKQAPATSCVVTTYVPRARVALCDPQRAFLRSAAAFLRSSTAFLRSSAAFLRSSAAFLRSLEAADCICRRVSFIIDHYLHHPVVLGLGKGRGEVGGAKVRLRSLGCWPVARLESALVAAAATFPLTAAAAADPVCPLAAVLLASEAVGVVMVNCGRAACRALRELRLKVARGGFGQGACAATQRHTQRDVSSSKQPSKRRAWDSTPRMGFYTAHGILHGAAAMPSALASRMQAARLHQRVALKSWNLRAESP